MYDEFSIAFPKDEDHLWEMIEFNFEHARHVLEDYPVETYEEAIRGTFRALAGGKFSLSPFRVLAYRDQGEDGYDQRDYCIELGRSTLPVVAEMIKACKLTPEFFQSWGILQFCHGYLASHLFATKEDLASKRAGIKTGNQRSKYQQRKWIARIMLPLVERGATRDQAEEVVVQRVRSAIENEQLRGGFSVEWFTCILTHGELAATYDFKHFLRKEMQQLVEESSDDIPPVPEIT